MIDKIISRQANVAGDELDFGITVSALLRKFGFHDMVAMNSYYSQLPNDVTWEGLLSSVRGQVIHSGAIHMNGRAELLAWFEFTRHLHDICKRVVLREIGYKGTYSASNIPYAASTRWIGLPLLRRLLNWDTLFLPSRSDRDCNSST